MTNLAKVLRTTVDFYKDEFPITNPDFFDNDDARLSTTSYCSFDDKCTFCKKDEEEKCIGKTYIMCPDCDVRTTYGYGFSKNIFYKCIKCNGKITVCSKCFNYETMLCQPRLLKSKFLERRDDPRFIDKELFDIKTETDFYEYVDIDYAHWKFNTYVYPYEDLDEIGFPPKYKMCENCSSCHELV